MLYLKHFSIHQVCIINDCLKEPELALCLEIILKRALIAKVMGCQMITCSIPALTNQVLCAWDLREYTLIQTLTVKFPFTQRLPEFGPNPMSLLPNSQTLVVICNEYIAEFKLGLTVSRHADSNFFTSHNQPLCGALYNRHFRQVGGAF